MKHIKTWDKMKEKEKEKQAQTENTKTLDTIGEEKQTPAPVSAPVSVSDDQTTPDNYKIYENNIYSYIDEFIEGNYAGQTETELKENRSFFPSLIQYLYNNYLGDALGNTLELKLKGVKPVYNDIKLLDELFNIYVFLVYKYKSNNRPSILEYSILTGINRNTIHSWLNGELDNYILQSASDDRRKYITSEYSSTVQKWQSICEQSLIDGKDTIKELFLLKCKYGYQEKNDINIVVEHKSIISAENLPDLIGINGKN